jgi:outer membrane receptor protein involved in Fe transport
VILGLRPLERFSLGVTGRIESGWPYTPVRDGVSGERYSDRLPWTWQFDLRVFRDFVSFGQRWGLYADIRNLFNRRNVRAVFAETGRADDPGPGAASWSDHYDRSWYFGPPRTINLGLRFQF